MKSINLGAMLVPLVMNCWMLMGLGAAAGQETPPDFTRGDLPSEAHDWLLGPTGARGWIFTRAGHSKAARQIFITAVAPGSPSDGVLQTGDVIVGVGGSKFASDARKALAAAIMNAESVAGDGSLKLLRWRAGQTTDVVIRLPVLGSYSSTAPYDCPKSSEIFARGTAALSQRMQSADYPKKLNPIPRALNALALLSRANPDDRELLQREAVWAANFQADSFQTWYYGYLMIYLAEYYAVTHDEQILPGLTRLALESARGQSAVGTWGHKFALPTGNLNGYGCMNQPGLSLTIGMVLARQAGVQHPDLDRAIQKSTQFVRWFVDKGAVPYGDHLPFPAHEDNGKCASAAILYDLVGDAAATEFFTNMSLAAFDERERGHTGNYFNMVWAMLGAARGGPQAAGVYWGRHAWYYDLTRDWEFKFVYQGSPVGEEEHGKYTDWDCSGSYLLGFSLPKRSLLLTGKNPMTLPPYSTAQATAIVAAGDDFGFRDDPHSYDRRSMEQLWSGLSSWSPFVRDRSAVALAKREGISVDSVLELLRGDNRYARYGACRTLAAMGGRADSAAETLRELLQSEDPWLQSLACDALARLSPTERRESVPHLLRMIQTTHPQDPRQMAQRAAAMALFAPYPGHREPKSILAETLDGVDRDLLYPAMRQLLQNEDSVARGSLARVYPKLTDRDIVELLPQMVDAIRTLAPSNEMFADGVRLAGLDLLSRLNIREGMQLCVDVIEVDRWGSGKRLKPCLEYLARYGTHAKEFLPAIEQIETQIRAKVRGPALQEQLQLVADFYETVRLATHSPNLLSIDEFRRQVPPHGASSKE